MRGLVAAALCVALQIGALCAPLVHAHLDDHHGDHHGARRVHAHFTAHGHHGTPADVTAVEAAGDSEQITRIETFVAVAAAAVAPPCLPPARFDVPPALESTQRQPPDVVRSHGPPGARLLPSRAPPVPSALI